VERHHVDLCTRPVLGGQHLERGNSVEQTIVRT
jgi:hypothetical protein